MHKSKIMLLCLVLLGTMGLAACGSNDGKGGLEGAAVPNDNGVVVEPGVGGGDRKDDPSNPAVPQPGDGSEGGSVTSPVGGEDPKDTDPGAGGSAGGSNDGGVVTAPEGDNGGDLKDVISNMGGDSVRTRLSYIEDACKANAACIAQLNKVTEYLRNECPAASTCTNPVAQALLYAKEPSASNRQAGICPIGTCVSIGDIKDIVSDVYGSGSDGSGSTGGDAKGGDSGSGSTGGSGSAGSGGSDGSGGAGGTTPGGDARGGSTNPGGSAGGSGGTGGTGGSDGSGAAGGGAKP